MNRLQKSEFNFLLSSRHCNSMHAWLSKNRKKTHIVRKWQEMFKNSILLWYYKRFWKGIFIFPPSSSKKYEVVAFCPKNKKFEKFCPKYSGQSFSNFFVHILGNATTSYFHSEISWPLSSTWCDFVKFWGLLRIYELYQNKSDHFRAMCDSTNKMEDVTFALEFWAQLKSRKF